VSSNLGIVVRKPLNREDIIARDFHAELKARVGTKTLVSPDNPNAAGFFCKETGKTLRDSISYLDHINGKRRAWLLPKPVCCLSPSDTHLLLPVNRATGVGDEHACGEVVAGGGAGQV
jgi:hypothetical protein